MAPSPDQILQVLDEAARNYTFPMLDNGYIYPAATRLTLFRSVDDWAVVFENFGFSPRAGFPDLPDLIVTTIGGAPQQLCRPQDFVSDDAYRAFIESNRHVASSYLYPIEDGDWQAEEDAEQVASNAGEIILRGSGVAIPSRSECEAVGVEPEGAALMVFELSRYLAETRRGDVLATETERRAHLNGDLQMLLMLDGWHHPDLASGELPSETESFRNIAALLAGENIDTRRLSLDDNTHWSNWPDGGTL